jgi:hypothetical protein
MFLERGERNDLKGPLVGGGQDDVGGRSVLVSAQPVDGGDAPPGARHEPGKPELRPRRAEVVADATLLLEELRGHHRADRVTSAVFGTGAAAPVAVGSR